MEVEFGLMKWFKSKWQMKLNAKTVTLPGGGSIAIQDEQDAKKEFVGGQHLRYSGILKWYDAGKKEGLVILDDGFAMDEKVPKKLPVPEHEINCGGKRPKGLKKDLEVEFGIVKNWKGKHLCYNMMLPGALPLTPENIERRALVGDRTFQGTVDFFSSWSKCGYIKPDTVARFPAKVRDAMQKEKEQHMKKKPDSEAELVLYFKRSDVNSWGKVQKGKKCTFQVYTDEKG